MISTLDSSHNKTSGPPHHMHAQFQVMLAGTPEDILAAQKLRYRVFALEMGAQLDSEEEGIDSDRFDSYCEHLIVKDQESGEVVGAYRILSPEQAKKIGSYYSESEFDLSKLAEFRHSLVEVGRSCVHPDYRQGKVINLLWAGLADYMMTRRYECFMGCASMSMADGGHLAVATFNHLKTHHMAREEWRVTPFNRVPLEAIAPARTIDVPPLIKAYIRAGAQICGEPAWDRHFNTADLLILLPMSQIVPRYFRRFAAKPGIEES